MSFLENLPCRNPDSFKTTVEMQKRYHGHITRSLGQGRDYLPLETDTTPPSSQVIKTDEANLLLRYLAKKQADENRMLQPDTAHAAPSTPNGGSWKDVMSDHDLEMIDATMDTPTRLKRKHE